MRSSVGAGTEPGGKPDARWYSPWRPRCKKESRGIVCRIPVAANLWRLWLDFIGAHRRRYTLSTGSPGDHMNLRRFDKSNDAIAFTQAEFSTRLPRQQRHQREPAIQMDPHHRTFADQRRYDGR